MRGLLAWGVWVGCLEHPVLQLSDFSQEGIASHRA